jgi:hypothetical protein
MPGRCGCGKPPGVVLGTSNTEAAEGRASAGTRAEEMGQNETKNETKRRRPIMGGA